MKTNDTVDFFIKKFSAIPASKWCVGTYTDGDRRCALGHCGQVSCLPTAMSDALENLLWRWLPGEMAVCNINDGDSPSFPQKTPKARILAALKWIKKYAKTPHC